MSIPEEDDPFVIETNPAAAPSGTASSSQAPIVIAGIWAVLALIFAVILLSSAKDEAYGGDAYTGMQNAVMLAVRGVAFLLIGSGALGLIISLKRDRG